jgi:hypothetical protein
MFIAPGKSFQGLSAVLGPARVGIAATLTLREMAMDGWWTEIDDQVRTCLEREGAMAPAELGRQLGLSEGAVTSVLSLLAQEGKLRIARVELPRREDGRQLSL